MEDSRIDTKRLRDGDKMVNTAFTRTLLQGAIPPAPQQNVLTEARKRVNALQKMQGCSKCRARLENPHADYHLTAVIDSSKI